MRQRFLSNCGLILRRFSIKSANLSKTMAGSKFEYVKMYERDEQCLQNCYIVVRIDGKDFSKFSDVHKFEKPNDLAALELMNQAAVKVMENFKEIILAYGQSDEYSFVFRKNTEQFKRRAYKLMTNVNSLFASTYVSFWSHFFKDREILYPPSFKAKIILFPDDCLVRDYLLWRQTDVYFKNLHNTCLWDFVQKQNMTPKEANERLKEKTFTIKDETLDNLRINYQDEQAIFNKGSILLRKNISGNGKTKKTIAKIVDDLNSDRFWIENSQLFGENYAQELKNSKEGFIRKVDPSEFNYLKKFEHDEQCLPNTYIVVRIDGRGFSKFSDDHEFKKPNDLTALELMNQAAIKVMEYFKEIVLAYGQSDEYSFVFRKDAEIFNRRAFKITSIVNSLFATSYVLLWPQFFKERKLLYPPSFDARRVLYPQENTRDYLSWRQADVHINNLHNTCFWNLVQKQNMTMREANERLKGTVSSDKNEMLFQDFGINYNNELPIFRKGTILLRKNVPDDAKNTRIEQIFDDLIGDRFWIENPQLFGDEYAEKLRILMHEAQSRGRGKSKVSQEDAAVNS